MNSSFPSHPTPGAQPFPAMDDRAHLADQETADQEAGSPSPSLPEFPDCNLQPLSLTALQTLSEVELFDLIYALQNRNANLLKRVANLEALLGEYHTTLELQQVRIKHQDVLLERCPQELTTSQEQISRLLSELEAANQTSRRQQAVMETLTQKLAESQQQVAQLERDYNLALQRADEQTLLHSQTELVCQDLRARLYRQQRYTLQFKAALEKCLDMSASSGMSSQADPELEPPQEIWPNQEDAAGSFTSQIFLPKVQPIQPWSEQLSLLSEAEMPLQNPPLPQELASTDWAWQGENPYLVEQQPPFASEAMPSSLSPLINGRSQVTRTTVDLPTFSQPAEPMPTLAEPELPAPTNRMAETSDRDHSQEPLQTDDAPSIGYVPFRNQVVGLTFQEPDQPPLPPLTVEEGTAPLPSSSLDFANEAEASLNDLVNPFIQTTDQLPVETLMTDIQNRQRGGRPDAMTDVKPAAETPQTAEEQLWQSLALLVEHSPRSVAATPPPPLSAKADSQETAYQKSIETHPPTPATSEPVLPQFQSHKVRPYSEEVVSSPTPASSEHQELIRLSQSPSVANEQDNLRQLLRSLAASVAEMAPSPHPNAPNGLATSSLSFTIKPDEMTPALPSPTEANRKRTSLAAVQLPSFPRLDRQDV